VASRGGRRGAFSGGVEEVGVGEEDDDVVAPGLGGYLKRRKEGGLLLGVWMGERGEWTGLAGLDQEKENGMVLSVDARCVAHYARLGDW
jgi:hypothetical protein